MENQELVVVECGGASAVDSRVSFDPTNKYIFCMGGKCVRVMEIESGECIRLLRHTNTVVGAVVNEENISQLLTCTVDGIISLWTYENGAKLKEWSLDDGNRVRAFIVPKYAPQTWYVIATGSKTTHLFALTRTKDGLSKRDIAKVSDDPRRVSIHDKGTFAAYAVSRKVYVMDLKTSGPPSELVGPDMDITLVMCHPTKDSVATGDQLGRIRLWHKVMGRRPVFTIYHWHSLPVSDIAFSREGTTMYSGGEEMVVVRWPLQSSSKEESKDFLPRTGAKISYLSSSPDSSLVAVSLQDNSIQIASSQLKIMKSIQGFAHNLVHSATPAKDKEQPESIRQLCYPVGLYFDGNGCGGEKTKGSLVTNGRPGYLQFYDPKKDKQRINLDVIGRNQPPPERGRPVSYFEVVRMAMCKDWVVTIDHRSDQQYSDETNLKFWKYEDENKSFKLNTWVDRPHSGLVSSLFFRSTEDGKNNQLALISTGVDGKFKVWELSMDTNIYDSKELWTCERAGYYRGQPATCGDFSPDGRMAVGFGHTLTLWNFEEHQMTSTLGVLPNGGGILKLQFGVAKGETDLIVVFSDQDLAVWNTVSQVCLWRLTTRPDLLCRDPSSGLFAAFFGSKICLFRLPSPQPVTVSTNGNFTKAMAAVFAPETMEKENAQSETTSPLYFITNDQRLMCLRKETDESLDDEVPNANPETARTPFAELLVTTKASKRKMAPAARSYETNMQLLSGAAHTLPTVSTIGSRFAESCLARKEANRQEDDQVFPDLTSEITFASLRLTYAK